jgi:hypothetical protein
MRKIRNYSIAVVALSLLALPLPLLAAGGNVVGTPIGGQNYAECSAAALTFTGPSDGAGLFQMRNSGSNTAVDANDIAYHLYNGSLTRICSYADANGIWKCVNNSFSSPPTSNMQTVWAIATVFPGGSPGGSHAGWMMYDNSPGLDDSSNRPNVMQKLRDVVAVAGSGTGAGGPNTGFDVSFEYPTEYGTNVIGDFCFAGGDQTPSGLDTRLFAGFNVYRLAVADIAAASSDPVDYLCGPDRDCSTTGDNGFVKFVDLTGTDVINVDNPGDTGTIDPDGKAVSRTGVEDRGAENAHVIFSDDSAPDMDASYAYVVQPVLRVGPGAPFTTWNGMQALDLDGDGVPEFIDPSGNGLGLTANGTSVPGDGNPVIFVTTDAVADGGVTPATGSIEMTARLTRTGIDLSFLSSIEGDVVGFNVFRAVNGSDVYTQVNGSVIAAKGTPLANYNFTDSANIRRMRAKSLEYKIQVLLADGTFANYGPYAVAVQSDRGAARRR